MEPGLTPFLPELDKHFRGGTMFVFVEVVFSKQNLQVIALLILKLKQ
jgi:hypothetical protein